MRIQIVTVLVPIFVTLCLFGLVTLMSGCKDPEKQYSTSRQQASQGNTIATKVIHFADEEKVDSLNRWLWNILTNRRVTSIHQLNAARLWLMLNNHIDCKEFVALESGE